MRLLGVLAALAACGGGDAGGPPPDANINGHGSGDDRLGLFVAWEPDPQVPGPLTNDLSASEVALQIRSLQFLSDAGDASIGNFTLRWNDTIEPLETTLPTAPAGLYSQVSIHLGGGADSAYRVIGTFRDQDGKPRTFRIEDDMSFAVALDCDKLLAAGGSTEVAIKIDLRTPLSAVMFGRLPTDDTGTVVLDDHTDPLQLDGFRKRLSAAFFLDN